MNSNIINKKSNLLNALMVAATIWGVSESAEARSSRLTESPWIPSSMSAAADDVSGLLTEDVVPEGQYYIRNAEAGIFLTGANSWGTRLSLKSAGDIISVAKMQNSNGYVLSDVSLRELNGVQIGEASGSSELWIDQTSPASGFKFHKLTAAEVKAIDDNESTGFGNGVGKDYYFIYYTNHKGETVFLKKDVPGESNNSQVSGEEFDRDAQRNYVWELLTEQKLKEDLYENATEESYMCATPLLSNPDFSRNYFRSVDDNGWGVEDGLGLSGIGGQNYNFIAYAKQKAFNIHQTLTDIPNGRYGVVAYAVYDGAPTDSGVYPYLYVKNSEITYVKSFKYSNEASDVNTWSERFCSFDERAKYLVDTIFVSVWDNTLTVGLEGKSTNVNAYFDNVQLFYFGMTKNLTTLNQKYSAVSKQGRKILTDNQPMGAECKQALQTAVNDIPDVTDPKSLSDAIENITKAIAAANASISLYAEIVYKYDVEVSKLSADAQSLYNENIRKPIIEAGLLTDESQLLVGLNAAKIYDRGKNSEVTDIVIVNPSFETGDLTGWNYVDVGGDSGIKSTTTLPYSMSGSDGSWLYNTWNNGVGGPISQTLKGLAPGTYILTAVMASTRDEKNGFRYLHLNAGDATTVKESQHENTGVPMSLSFRVDDISEVKITAWASGGATAVLNGNDQSWFKVDNFHLIYEEQECTPEQAEQMIAEALNKYIGELMNKDVEANLINAIKAFRDDPSLVNEQAFIKAQQAAEASIKLYKDVMNDVVTYKAAAENYNNNKGFDENGRWRFENLIKQIEDAITNRILAAGDEDIVKNAYHEALTAQASGDFTELIVNPGFETGDLTGWTTDTGADVGVRPAYGNPVYETFVDGCNEGEAPLFNYIFNTWTNENGERGTIIKQTIKNIPNGKYRVSAYLATYGDYYAFVFGNDSYSEPANVNAYGHNESKFHAVKAEVVVTVTNGELTIGAVGGVAADGSVPGNLFPVDYPTVKGGWYKADAFTLEYLGALYNEEVASVISKAKNLDTAGYEKFDQLSADIIKAYENGNAIDDDKIAVLWDNLRVATKAQVTEHTDWTGAIYNPSFEDKGLHWGAMSGYKSLETVKVSSMAWSHADGERYAYRLNETGAPVQINYYQNIDTVAIGIYKVKATVYTNSKTVSIYGNDFKTAITPCSSIDEGREVEQIVVSWNGQRITLGIIGTLNSGEQIRVDNFRLEYISNDLDIEEDMVPDDVQINKDIRNQQNNAIEQFRENPQPAYLSAAIDAIAAAKESEKIYKQFADYFDKVKELDEAAQSMFNRLAKDVIDAYDNGDITDGVAELEIVERSFKAVFEYAEAPKVIVKIDFSDVQPSEGENTTTPVVTVDGDDNSVYVFEPADQNKDQVISISIPLDVIVAGTTYKIIIDLYPVFGAYARPNYLTFGLKGNGSKVSDRYHAPGEAGEYSLGKYTYANDKEMMLEYEFTATEDMQNPVFEIKTETPADAVDESTRIVGLKGVTLVSDASATAIETTRTETEIIPISINNISGVNISSFQKGINVVRFSDGSVKKVYK